MIDLEKVLTRKELEKAPEADVPRWKKPMLATLTDKRFSRKEWIFERKLDGERCLLIRRGPSVALRSRNDKDITHTYPEIAEAFEKATDSDMMVDGEIVAFEGSTTSFSRLQHRMQRESGGPDTGIAVYVYVFDLLYGWGRELTRLPLRTRKKLLKRGLDFSHKIRFGAHRVENGEAYYQEACRKGWEGVIAKDGNSTYVHNRSSKWLKFKCETEQEFVIGGYTDPEGEREKFGALLLGYYSDKGNLVYAGMVGTGFDHETLRSLSGKMEGLRRDSSPFQRVDRSDRASAHWVEPQLVGQVAFTEWTSAGKLRHPAFKGLRRDKDPKEVVREEPSG